MEIADDGAECGVHSEARRVYGDNAGESCYEDGGPVCESVQGQAILKGPRGASEKIESGRLQIRGISTKQHWNHLYERRPQRIHHVGFDCETVACRH